MQKQWLILSKIWMSFLIIPGSGARRKGSGLLLRASAYKSTLIGIWMAKRKSKREKENLSWEAYFVVSCGWGQCSKPEHVFPDSRPVSVKRSVLSTVLWDAAQGGVVGFASQVVFCNHQNCTGGLWIQPQLTGKTGQPLQHLYFHFFPWCILEIHLFCHRYFQIPVTYMGDPRRVRWELNNRVRSSHLSLY